MRQFYGDPAHFIDSFARERQPIPGTEGQTAWVIPFDGGEPRIEQPSIITDKTRCVCGAELTGIQAWQHHVASGNQQQYREERAT